MWYFILVLLIVVYCGGRLWGGQNTHERMRVCISPAPQSPSPKLETTRSLIQFMKPVQEKCPFIYLFSYYLFIYLDR